MTSAAIATRISARPGRLASAIAGPLRGVTGIAEMPDFTRMANPPSGPLSHRVDDARFVLPILAGPDGRDPSCPPVAPAREPAVTGLRIAVHRQTSTARSAAMSPPPSTPPPARSPRPGV